MESERSMEQSLAPMIPRGFRTRRMIHETADTFTLELESPNGSNSFVFRPGQFNMIYVPGVGEIPISISGDPSRPESLVHTTRAVGAVTTRMKTLRRGDFVGIRGPYGAPWPVEDAIGLDVVLVAGGIGLAPLRPVVLDLLSRREQFGRIILLYGTREPNDILFRKHLEQWRTRFDMDIHITVDRAIGAWKGNVGVVTTLIPKAPFDPLNTVAMVCGPEIMMRFTSLEFMKRGVPQNRIFLSLERNMKCGIGLCGHCQFGPHFVCKDGPVFSYGDIKHLLSIREF